ncbi:MAG: hypothetical protein IJ166_02660 [Prevotella sp.]|nr:hypothetical protein [Prevotella sp.]
MEGLIKEELIKRRGYIATLEAGYRFFVDNFKTIFKHMWPYALAFGIVLGIFEMIQLKTSMTGDVGTAEAATTLILLPVVMIVAFLLGGRMMMLFNDQSFKWNTIRYIKLTLWLSLVAILILFISASAFLTGDSTETGMFKAGALFFLIFTVLLIVVYLPYIYPALKYMLEPQTHFRNLIFKGWKKGFKHWGYIFVTVLLLYLCIMVMSIIIFIPLGICSFAQTISAAGVADGDASGMPGYFNILFFVVAAISFFVYSFISVFSLSVAYYMYGNIEAYEREKEKQLQPIETTTDEATENTVY